MVPAVLVSTSNSERKNDSLIKNVDLDARQIHNSQLIMQWTLDENSKLICKWVKVQH